MTNERTIQPNKFVWMDAYEGEGEWYGTDQAPERRLMVTYGYPIAITDDYISIASTYDAELEQYACVINIPIGMLVSTQLVTGKLETNVSVETSFTLNPSTNNQK